jgi:anti-anti-sigma factor
VGVLVVDEVAGVVRAGGLLDVRSVGDLRDALGRMLDATTGDVVLDVSGVDGVDATGLGVILAVHRRAAAQGRRLVLDGVGPGLARILAVTKLHRVLTVRRGEPQPQAGRARP